VAIERNSFIGLQAGVYFNWGSWYNVPLAIYICQPGRDISYTGQRFRGLQLGISVLGYSGPVAISRNRFQDCTSPSMPPASPSTSLTWTSRKTG